MSRQLALLHNAEVELQALVTRRVAMFAANLACELKDEPLKYSEADFEQLGAEIRQAAIDPTQFDL